MDPQKNLLAPQSGDDQQNNNPAGPAPEAASSDLSKEAIDTPAVGAPVAGEKIEPEVPAPAGDAPGAGPAASEPPANAPAPDAGFGTPDSQQSTSPGPAAPAGMSVNPNKRAKKGLIIGLVVAAVTLLISGGAAAAYFGYYIPKKPENVLKKALANSLNLEKSKTIHFSGEVTVSSEEDDLRLKTTFSGQADQTSGSLLFSSATDALLTNITTEVRSVDGKTFYFKAGGLDGLSELLALGSANGADLFAPLVQKLNNQWIEISEGFIGQALGGSYRGLKLSESDSRKLAGAYEQNEFIVVKEVLPDEDIKGVRSYHYRVGYDAAKFKSFLRAANNSNLDIIKLTDKELNELFKAFDEVDLSAPWEIWIGKKDKMIRQMVIEVTEDGAGAELRFTVDNYNQPVTVEKPEDPISLLELMGTFLQFDMFESLLEGDDQNLLQSELETFFTEYESAETSSTGISL